MNNFNNAIYFADIPVYYLTLDDFKEKFINCNNIKLEHILYDPILDQDNKNKINADNEHNHCDIFLIRSVVHDGTLYFLHELIINTFSLIINSCINDKRRENEYPILYKIGKMRIETEGCEVINKYGILLSSRNIVCIPIKFEY